MIVIKRNGSEVGFDITKIIAAITKANDTVDESSRMTPIQIQRIAQSVELSCQKMNRSPSVEEIQDLVEHQILAHGAFEVAKNYITYRYTRSLVRKSNTTDDKILSLIECCNEEAKQENSNKNPVVNSTQRDYMAGEVSRDLSERILLPADIAEERLREEVRRGVQTIQYQVVTLLTTNGQAPFVTVYMYLNEARSEREKQDLALIIEETLLQR